MGKPRKNLYPHTAQNHQDATPRSCSRVMTSVRLTATQLRGSFYGYANIGVYSLSRLPSGKVDFVSINGEVNQAIQLQA